MAAGARESSKVQNSNPNYSSANGPTPTGGSSLGAPPNAGAEQNNGWDFSGPPPDATMRSFGNTMGAYDNFIHGVMNTAMAGLPMGDLGLGAALVGKLGSRAIGLPGASKVGIDMAHILANHTEQGAGAIQSGFKTLFPYNMSAAQIQREILQAYATAQKIGVQNRSNGDRVAVLLGVSKSGTQIQIYLNLTTRIIETAFIPRR